MEEKMEPRSPRKKFIPWKTHDADYQEFLQLQTVANLETEKKFREQEDKAIKLQQQLDSMEALSQVIQSRTQNQQ